MENAPNTNSTERFVALKESDLSDCIRQRSSKSVEIRNANGWFAESKKPITPTDKGQDELDVRKAVRFMLSCSQETMLRTRA